MTGKLNTSKWQQTEDVDFFTLKGVIENIFEELNLTQRVLYSPCEDVKYLHPKRSANAVVLGKNKAPVARFGQLHPIIKDKLKFNQDIFLFEIDLDSLLSNVSNATVSSDGVISFKVIFALTNACIILIIAITWWAHRKNIQRLLVGEEHPTNWLQMIKDLKFKSKVKKHKEK